MQVRGLGYIGIDATDLASWSAFATDVLGMMPGEAGPGQSPDPERLTFRMDRRAFRLAVQRAEKDGCAYVGWELPSRSDFDAALAELVGHGVVVAEGTAEQAAQRRVAQVASFVDPFGNQLELFWGQSVEEAGFVSPSGISAFRTDLGMGHVLYAVDSCAEAVAFYGEVLGLRVTDHFDWGGPSAWFMRSNERHHAVGFVDVPLPGGPGLNHFMIEADTLTDVGRALDRAVEGGHLIVNSLGQHVNDRAVSFYVQSPSGFSVEVGVDQLRVDESSWSDVTWTGRGEIWGHHGPFMDDIDEGKVSA